MYKFGLLFTLCNHAAGLLTRANGSCDVQAFSSVLSSYSELRIANATKYAANAYTLAGTSNSVAFCALDAVISYGPNETLLFSLWLPDKPQYQDRFLAVGNGALAGVIDLNAMLNQLNSGLGLAVAGGDAGHKAADNNNGLGQPGVYLPFLHNEAQILAWIRDAISLFTPAAKSLTEAYYGNSIKYTYYDGCSTGGAQGLALSQYHPELFDGIVAGSPGNWYSHLALSFLWNAQATNSSESRLPQDKLDLITNAVIKTCDGKDGVEDGLIENPLDCRFDVTSLQCSNDASAANCLTSAQVKAAKAVYQGPRGKCDGTQIYPGFSVGSESEWGLQQGNLANLFTIPLLQNLVYDDLSYDASTFEFDYDVNEVDDWAGSLIDERSPDLSAFRQRKGKMIITQGWTDGYNAATWPIEYLGQIQYIFQSDASEFVNLFMIPGGGHCGAAFRNPAVPAKYVTMPALIKWVEQGQKPDDLLSTTPPDGSSRTRKLCPWPNTANYVSGDKNSSASYTCR